MLRVLNVIGTRPEAAKLAPVIQELSRHPGRFQVHVCSTGQHRAMARAANPFGDGRAVQRVVEALWTLGGLS